MLRKFLSWFRSKPIEPTSVVPTREFCKGDLVSIYGHNPYSGDIRCGRPYRVRQASSSFILLGADNGTVGCFNSRHFSKWQKVPPKNISMVEGKKKQRKNMVSRARAARQFIQEYEEIINAVDILEKVTKMDIDVPNDQA